MGIWSLVTVKRYSSLPVLCQQNSWSSYGISFSHTQSWEPALGTPVHSTETLGLQPTVCPLGMPIAQGQSTVPGTKQVFRKGITGQNKPKHCTGHLRAGLSTSATALQVSELLSPFLVHQPMRSLPGTLQVSTHTNDVYIKSSCHRTFL